MKKILFFCSAALVLASCMAPRVVTRLTPEAPEGHYEMGREYISLSSDSITTELAFDGIHQDHLVFDFVVVNNTSSALSVHPTDFYYVILDSALADSSKLPPRMAVHPERILHHYEETLEEWSGDKELNAVLGFVDAGIGMILNTTAYFVSQDITLIRDEKEIVQEEILRSVTLPPGKVASGYVYFPQDYDARYCMFCFPVDNQLFQFVYHQQQELLFY